MCGYTCACVYYHGDIDLGFVTTLRVLHCAPGKSCRGEDIIGIAPLEVGQYLLCLLHKALYYTTSFNDYSYRINVIIKINYALLFLGHIIFIYTHIIIYY